MHDRRRTVSCADFATLVDYWFGDLEPAREEALEENLFGCERCTMRLEELVQLGAGIRAAFRGGGVRAVIPHALLEAMRQERLRLREYRLAPGSSVNCTIAAEDDFVVAMLQAPLAGVQRVDLVSMGEHGAPDGRFEDVPFEAATGEVLVCPAPAALKKRPAYTHRMQLIAVDAAAERTLGEYTFVHTPERK
jgi:anti-sigma factor RsiW